MSDYELKESIAARGRAKASITRLKNSFNKEALLNSELELLLVKRERLITAFNEYDRLSARITALNLEPDKSDNLDEDDVEDTYLHLLSQLDAIANTLRSNKGNPPPDTKPATGPGKIKLPSVVIPTFTGKYTEYYEFMSMFTAMIHTETTFSCVQKLYYLKGFLSGEPLALINNLPLQDDSYTEALRLLKERYDNKVRITHEHIGVLLDMPAINRSNVTNLRAFLSVVKQNLAALKNLGEMIDTWDSIIICILSRKLDTMTYRAFQMERDNTIPPTVKEFIDFIEKRALAIENTDCNVQKVQSQRLASYPVATQSHQIAACIYCPATAAAV
ncbi:uncharacterized protein [Choristoneura fumiferana]|uniref:uncharacterized protein n=1 Tax=Choristoneura fumiferana TaxID=7141 RepID=UPI003D1583C5